MSTTVFSLQIVQRLRLAAARAVPPPEPGPEGWSQSTQDPLALLAAFPALRLRAGWTLRAYQFREGGNGNGVVWAMPVETPFPAPDACSRLREAFLAPPRPPEALDSVMAALEGDGSPWAYLSASLFARAIEEFGALWHGASWSTHTLLGGDPWAARSRSRREGPSGDPTS